MSRQIVSLWLWMGITLDFKSKSAAQVILNGDDEFRDPFGGDMCVNGTWRKEQCGLQDTIHNHTTKQV